MFKLRSVHSKLIILFIIVIVIPILILYAFMFNTFHSFSIDKVIDTSLYDAKLVSYGLDQLLQKTENLSMNIFSDVDLSRILIKYSSMDPGYDKQQVKQEIEAIIFDYLYLNSELHSIYVFDLNQNIIGVKYKTDFSSSYILSQMDYKSYKSKLAEVYRNNSRNVWYYSFINDGKKSLSSARLLKNIYNQKPIGYLVININQSNINSYIKDSKNDFIILNKDGEIISCNINSSIDPYSFSATFFERINSNKQKKNYLIPKINDNKMLVVYNYSPSTGLYTINISSLDQIYSRLDNYKLLIGIASGLCILFIFIILAFFSFRVFIPLVNLRKTMKRVECGNLDINVSYSRKDEVGDLYDSFNTMIKMLKTSFETRLKEEELKKHAELRALQAQINPHFMYNTLNSIKWLANIHKIPNISMMITSFVKLLRHTIGKDGEYISIREEIENISNYVYIEKIRFGDKFSIVYNIDESIMDYRILKLVLQPIIENSIFHGFKEMEGQGIICVYGREINGDIIFEIIDNGIGMEQDRAFEILASARPNEHSLSSIGIKNINERLKLNYGEKYGIKIKSAPEKGTRVTLKYPKLENKKQ